MNFEARFHLLVEAAGMGYSQFVVAPWGFAAVPG